MNRRQFGKLAARGAAAGLVVRTLGETLALGQGYPPAPNYTPLTNWLSSNNSSSVLNAFRGPRRNVDAYYPKDGMGSLTPAQANELGICMNDWLNVANTNFTGGSLNSAMQALGEANYNVDGWVTFVSVDWDACYQYWETWTGGPYVSPVSESTCYDCWEEYYQIVFPVYGYPPVGSWPYTLNSDGFTSTVGSVINFIKNLECGPNVCTECVIALVVVTAVGLLSAIVGSPCSSHCAACVGAWRRLSRYGGCNCRDVSLLRLPLVGVEARGLPKETNAKPSCGADGVYSGSPLR